MAIHVNSYSDGVVLERWSIRETDNGTRHFVGFSVMDHEGRVSTPVVSFDPESRTGITSSGSTYSLVGRAGNDRDGEYVWRNAARAWNVRTWRDVTPDLVPDWRMWLPKTERLAQDDGEGEVISYPEISQASAGSDEVHRMDRIWYRANAHVGHNTGPQHGLKPISTVTGNGSIVFARPVPDDRILRLLIATRVLLAEKMKRTGAVDEISFVLPSMTVTLENLSQPDDEVGEEVARLHMTIDECGMSAQLKIVNQSELTFGPIVARRHERIWAAVLLILPDWGEAGFVSRWE